jgi:hypothetical protein
MKTRSFVPTHMLVPIDIGSLRPTHGYLFVWRLRHSDSKARACCSRSCAGDKDCTARIAAGRDSRSATPMHARHFVDTMRGLFRWAVEAQHVRTDPTLGVKYPKLPKTGYCSQVRSISCKLLSSDMSA